VNLLPLDGDEKITAVIPVKEFNENEYLVMATRKGIIKKTALPNTIPPAKRESLPSRLRMTMN
jgi:DNA gyrase subunit A